MESRKFYHVAFYGGTWSAGDIWGGLNGELSFQYDYG